MLFGVKIRVGCWLQGRNSLRFPQDRPGMGDLHRRKGRRDLAGSIFITGTDAQARLDFPIQDRQSGLAMSTAHLFPSSATINTELPDASLQRSSFQCA